MSEPYPPGIRYFLSDSFDNLFKLCASPIKVAFIAGFAGGLVIGVGIGYLGRNTRRAVESAHALYRAVINITSLQYTDEIRAAGRDINALTITPELQAALQNLFSTLPGAIRVEILDLQPGSLMVTFDINTDGQQKEEEIRQLLKDTLNSGYLGGYRVSPDGFEFRRIRGGNERPTTSQVDLSQAAFNKALEAILSALTPIFKYDEDLFAELIRYMHFPTRRLEILRGDINRLKEIVAPSLMQDYKNQKLSEANFCALVVEFLTRTGKIPDETIKGLNKTVNDLTRRSFEADILLLYAEDDEELATDIADCIRKETISVKLVGDDRIDNFSLSSLHGVFRRYIYVFVIATKKLKADALGRFIQEMTTSKSTFHAKQRVIPVQLMGLSSADMDPVLRPFKPWRYWEESSMEQLTNMIKTAHKKIFNDQSRPVNIRKRSE